MNYIDVIAGRAQETYSGGRYYKEMPTSSIPEAADGVATAGPQRFNYEYVDVTEWRYSRLLGNVIGTDGADTTVKTRAPIDFKPNGYVALRDGNLYQIRSCTLDTTEGSKMAARILLMPRGTARILRLLKVPDPFGIGGRRE